MKKILSVFLAVLMILAMIPTAFAASSTPVITTSVDNTNIKAGDIVTVTVKVSQNSKLCALLYELYYNTSEFELVENSATLSGAFGFEEINTDYTNKVRYAATTSSYISDAANTLFTIQFRALKSSATLSVSILEAYVSTNSSTETNVTSAVVAASTKTISLKSTSTDYITIRKPSRTTISYKDGIVLHADVKTTLPNGSKIEWTTNNNKFKTSVSSDGKSCTIVSNSNGTTEITAILYSSNGSVLDTEIIEMTSKAGFFDIIIGFFRSLFRLSKTYSE